MCKICGRIVAGSEEVEVEMAGRIHTVCESCQRKKIPMLTPIPGRY